jgi:hypothetical protein
VDGTGKRSRHPCGGVFSHDLFNHGSKGSKPAKPRPDFPLFPHATGRWAKKIRGKLHYFGKWADPDAALRRYVEERDDLYAGRKPRRKGEGLEAHNICYQRLRYLLQDGTSRTAPLPASVQGHFAATLRGYVLYQHHQNLVTQPLIREELLDFGIDISTGQIDRLLAEGHDPFHQEKDACCAWPVSQIVHLFLANFR